MAWKVPLLKSQEASKAQALGWMSASGFLSLQEVQAFRRTRLNLCAGAYLALSCTVCAQACGLGLLHKQQVSRIIAFLCSSGMNVNVHELHVQYKAYRCVCNVCARVKKCAGNCRIFLSAPAANPPPPVLIKEPFGSFQPQPNAIRTWHEPGHVRHTL